MKLLTTPLGEHASLTCYIHEPSGEMGNIKTFPAILVVPGGGFRMCSDREGEPVALAFFAEGYSAFVLDYTTVTKKPDATIDDPMNDCNAAIAWIREHAQELYLTEGKLAMIGFSGGGHLAAAVATHGPNRPDLLLLGYPGILHSALRALECPDIIERVDASAPSTFLFSTNDDMVVPPKHPLAYAKALDDAGVDYELHIFRSGVHGLTLAKSLTSSGDRDNVNDRFAQWFPMAVQWLKEKWGDFTVYGVNDGRCGRYSIDTKIGEILASEEAGAVLRKYIPVDELAGSNPIISKVSVRALLGWGFKLPDDQVQALDEALLKL